MALTTCRSPTRRPGAYRADLSVGLGDFFKGRDGRFTFYKQNLDAGYSAPGQATIKDTEQYGGTFRMPVTSRLSLAAKGDQRIEDQGLETRAIELDVGYQADRQVERQHRRAQRSAQGPFAGCSADPGAGRAHGRGRAGDVRSRRLLARLWLRPGHGRGKRRP